MIFISSDCPSSKSLGRLSLLHIQQSTPLAWSMTSADDPERTPGIERSMTAHRHERTFAAAHGKSEGRRDRGVKSGPTLQPQRSRQLVEQCLASFRSAVSKPSVNQPITGEKRLRTPVVLFCECQRRARWVAARYTIRSSGTNHDGFSAPLAAS